MGQDARFWRNVVVIAFAHIAVLLVLARWNAEARRPNLQGIVWLNSSSTETVVKELEARSDIAPFNESPSPEQEEQSESPDVPSAQSDIHLPYSATTPVSKPPPKVTANVVPKATPKKSVVAKAVPKPSAKKKTTPPADEEGRNGRSRGTPKTASANTNVAEAGISARASEFSWYGKMLHDRFYSEWSQPTTSAPIGAKISALVRVRIEQDGRVSDFVIVRPSGNVVVDESVAAIAKRVTKVDPLPRGLGGAFYEVNINFELSPNP